MDIGGAAACVLIPFIVMTPLISSNKHIPTMVRSTKNEMTDLIRGIDFKNFTGSRVLIGRFLASLACLRSIVTFIPPLIPCKAGSIGHGDLHEFELKSGILPMQWKQYGIDFKLNSRVFSVQSCETPQDGFRIVSKCCHRQYAHPHRWHP